MVAESRELIALGEEERRTGLSALDEYEKKLKEASAAMTTLKAKMREIERNEQNLPSDAVRGLLALKNLGLEKEEEALAALEKTIEDVKGTVTRAERVIEREWERISLERARAEEEEYESEDDKKVVKRRRVSK